MFYICISETHIEMSMFLSLLSGPKFHVCINVRTKVRENTREFGTLECRDATATPILESPEIYFNTDELINKIDVEERGSR